MAGVVEVLALSDDEYTPRSKKQARSRPGTLPSIPITPCKLQKFCIQRGFVSMLVVYLFFWSCLFIFDTDVLEWGH